MPSSLKTWPLSLVFVAASIAITPMQVSAQTAQKAPGAYTVNPGDDIEVYVWGEERLQRSIKILPDGTFSFPLVGLVVAQGKTPGAIEAEISKALASQYHGQPPQVTVSVRGPSGYVFSVIGRVKGSSTFSPGRYVNVLEAIAMAGGPDEFANLDNVTIIRKTSQGLTTQRVRLGSAMKGNLPESAASTIPQIEVGDTVIVP